LNKTKIAIQGLHKNQKTRSQKIKNDNFGEVPSEQVHGISASNGAHFLLGYLSLDYMKRGWRVALKKFCWAFGENRFFVCNFYEFFEEDSNNLFIFIRLAGYGEFGCGRRPR
jgi:hypothetical protein